LESVCPDRSIKKTFKSISVPDGRGVDDSKILSDYEPLNAANSQHPKTRFPNLQKSGCFIDGPNRAFVARCLNLPLAATGSSPKESVGNLKYALKRYLGFQMATATAGS
jgi:hypothetical protein